ncbi:hypothetical protein BACEGG_02411 [Bacteroides eggerthii DSM 20697]|nr:hypothetical protein BACEGG_02411 [Bacteroides eggerthii DSM 20697]
MRDLSQRIFFFSVVTAAAATATGGTVLFGVVEAERHVVGAAFGGGSGVVDKAQTAVGEEADVHFVDVLYGAFFRAGGSFAVESGVEHTEAVQFYAVAVCQLAFDVAYKGGDHVFHVFGGHTAQFFNLLRDALGVVQAGVVGFPLQVVQLRGSLVTDLLIALHRFYDDCHNEVSFFLMLILIDCL